MSRSCALGTTAGIALTLVVGARFHREILRPLYQTRVARFHRAPTEPLDQALEVVLVSSRFIHHLYRIWKGGQIRFRLETFGLYYPALPYQSPWWRVSPGTARLLLRRLPAYARWLDEMETVRRGGGAAWWARFERNQPRPNHV